MYILEANLAIIPPSTLNVFYLTLQLQILAPYQNLEHCYEHLEMLGKTEDIFKFIAKLTRN